MKDRRITERRSQPESMSAARWTEMEQKLRESVAAEMSANDRAEAAERFHLRATQEPVALLSPDDLFSEATMQSKHMDDAACWEWVARRLFKLTAYYGLSENGREKK
mgnify:CR=1 FL=1